MEHGAVLLHRDKDFEKVYSARMVIFAEGDWVFLVSSLRGAGPTGRWPETKKKNIHVNPVNPVK
jgi:hypothetical protein